MLSPIAKGISMSAATSDVLLARGQLLCWCFCIKQLIDHLSLNHKSKETRHHSRHHFMSMHVTTLILRPPNYLENEQIVVANTQGSVV